MNCLSIDFETYSPVDLGKCGVHVYAKHPEADVICAAIGTDYVWHPGMEVEKWVLEVLGDPTYKLAAYNAQFERTIWENIMVEKYGFPSLPLEKWYCTAAQCAALALPARLDHVGSFLELDVVKDNVGKQAMMRLCKPAKDTTDRPEPKDGELQTVYDYCQQDVKAEMEIANVTRKLPEDEYLVWLLDQKINDRGLYVDKEFAQAALKLWEEYVPTLDAKIQEITGGISGTQVGALKSWLATQGVATSTLSKDYLRQLLLTKLPDNVRKVLKLRLEIGSTAVKKFNSFVSCAGEDSRIRGTLAYHRASTGRWSGRLLQPQNMMRGIFNESEQWQIPIAMDLVREQDIAGLSFFWDDLGDVIGSLCRPTIQAAPGNKLIVADFASIEARCVAWLAGQDDMTKAFRDNEDQYVRMASKIYDKPANKINKQERFIGKSAVLGCFASDTRVLTDSGWKPIIDVTLSDKLWDGIEWVTHEGLVYQGVKQTLNRHGVRATPDHLFLTPSGWQKWEAVDIKIATEMANLPPGFDGQTWAVVDAATRVAVWDITLAGPRNRYTILTDHGPVLVHNCGYGMGAPKFANTVEMQTGIKLEESFAKRVINTYRKASPKIVTLWNDLERLFKDCIETGRPQKLHGLRFTKDGKWLYVTLPSGRDLAYYKPKIVPGKRFGTQIEFTGVDNQSGKAKRETTYGGKLLENFSSGICRDLLVDAMFRLEDRGYRIVTTIHDEIVCEVPEDFGSAAEMERLMCQVPSWAEGFPIGSEGYESKFYRK